MKDIELFIENSRLMFVFLFFSGVFFGVVAQRIVDNKDISPLIKRFAVALITTSIAVTIGKFGFNLKAHILYALSPIIGFFGETIVEILNKEKTGISRGLIEWFIEHILKIPINKKEDGEENTKK